MKRIIDKQTGLFIRDDFTFNEETEIGLEVEPSQGLYLPKWNGTEWVEGIDVIPTPQVEEVIEKDLEQRVVSIEETLDVLLGGSK